MIGLFGTAPLAAGAIAIQIAGMAFMIPLSVSQATAIRLAMRLAEPLMEMLSAPAGLR